VRAITKDSCAGPGEAQARGIQGPGWAPLAWDSRGQKLITGRLYAARATWPPMLCR